MSSRVPLPRPLRWLEEYKEEDTEEDKEKKEEGEEGRKEEDTEDRTASPCFSMITDVVGVSLPE